MTDAQQREAARQFFYKWHGKGREDEDARSYWIDIFQDVLGMNRVTDRVEFEKKVIGADGNTKKIEEARERLAANVNTDMTMELLLLGMRN